MDARQRTLVEAYHDALEAMEAGLSPALCERLMPLLHQLMALDAAFERANHMLTREITRLGRQGTTEADDTSQELETAQDEMRTRRRRVYEVYYHAEELERQLSSAGRSRAPNL